MVVSSKVKMSISQITKYDQHVLSQLQAQTIYLIIILSVTDNISQTVNRNRTKQLLVFVLAGSRKPCVSIVFARDFDKYELSNI